MKNILLGFKIHGFKEGLENTILMIVKRLVGAKEIQATFDNRFYESKRF